MARYGNKNPWNVRAGTNRHSREARGQHTPNPGYKEGDNWLVCQRCGMDVYASKAREDGYREGLIVCPKCYDAPHPQDYVRAFDDTLTPSGLSTGDSDTFLRTATIAGSTTNPSQQTFTPDDFTGSIGSLPDRTDTAGDTISTISSSAQFPTAVYDTLLGADQTVSNWSATNLATSIVINASTGDITGTIDSDADDDSPFSTTVTATYANGHTIALSFTWTVTAQAFLPDQISGLYLWWDFSEAQYVWQDGARSVPIVDLATIGGVTDRSGNSRHGSTNTGQDYEGTWNVTGRNGLGTFQGEDTGSSQPSNLASVLSTPAITQPYTVVTVSEIPTITGNGNVFWAYGASGTLLQIGGPSSSKKSRLETNRTSPPVANSSTGGPLWTNHTNQWFTIVTRVDGTDTTQRYNDQESATPYNTHDASDVIPGLFIIGTLSGSTNSYEAKISEVLIYNKSLSTAEETQLYNYLNSKWSTPDTPLG